MPAKITEKTFFKYLKCPSWIYRDVHETEAEVDPLFFHLLEEGLLPEKERTVISDRPDLAEVTAEDPEEAFRQTLEFMRAGRKTIYQGVLIHGHWVGNPDILAKVEGQSVLGNYYYVAADVKRGREVRESYKFQGCFYAELLLRLQKTKPVCGYIISPDKKIFDYSIETFESEFNLTLNEIEKIVAGEKPPHFLTAGCKQTPWYGACRLETETCRDLSVLNRVWHEEVMALKQVGIQTLDELAGLSLSSLEKKAPKVRRDRLEIIHLQARALIENKHYLLNPPNLPSAEVELYFDIEGDPLRDFDFLFGVLEVKNNKSRYYSFLATTPEEEGEMWNNFLAFLTKRPLAPIYHYGWYELEVFRRFAARYGLNKITQSAIEAQMHDLLFLIRPSIVFPLSFYSLKDLGVYVGYKWQAEDASGVQAVRWFEGWLKSHDEKLMKKILDYNKDDVKATWLLKDWVVKQFFDKKI